MIVVESFRSVEHALTAARAALTPRSVLFPGGSTYTYYATPDGLVAVFSAMPLFKPHWEFSIDPREGGGRFAPRINTTPCSISDHHHR